MNIRHSSPDTYRKLQLPLGKRELPSTPSAALGHPTAAEAGRDPGQRSSVREEQDEQEE